MKEETDSELVGAIPPSVCARLFEGIRFVLVATMEDVIS